MRVARKGLMPKLFGVRNKIFVVDGIFTNPSKSFFLRIVRNKMERSGNVRVEPTIFRGVNGVYVTHHHWLDDSPVGFSVGDVKPVEACRQALSA